MQGFVGLTSVGARIATDSGPIGLPPASALWQQMGGSTCVKICETGNSILRTLDDYLP